MLRTHWKMQPLDFWSLYFPVPTMHVMLEEYECRIYKHVCWRPCVWYPSEWLLKSGSPKLEACNQTWTASCCCFDTQNVRSELLPSHVPVAQRRSPRDRSMDLLSYGLGIDRVPPTLTFHFSWTVVSNTGYFASESILKMIYHTGDVSQPQKCEVMEPICLRWPTCILHPSWNKIGNALNTCLRRMKFATPVSGALWILGCNIGDLGDFTPRTGNVTRQIADVVPVCQTTQEWFYPTRLRSIEKIIWKIIKWTKGMEL